MAASSDDRGNERAGGAEAEPEEKTDGWLTTYADMVTLLLTFFVLLFALSNSDNEKAEMFLFAMARGGLTAEQFMEIQDRYNLDESDYDPWSELLPYPGSEESEDPNHGGDEALTELYEAVGSYMEEEELGDHFSLIFNGDFLLITLLSDILFDSGQADMRPEMVARAEMLATLLAATYEPNDPFEIMVVGHTDSVPISTAQYPSNWHLSVARATNFLWVLVDISELEPDIFSVRGMGEYRPVATNGTEEGRALNRRVEIMIGLARNNTAWDTEIVYD
ncbi:MAG: OmpA family protein [Oscillospiraceae bacterium]|nr:OmpA family protein [Oscillospiraceae bacterium]